MSPWTQPWQDVAPRSGLLLLFPACLDHAVLVNQDADELRCSITVDFALTAVPTSMGDTPPEYLAPIGAEIAQWIQDHPVTCDATIVNTRNPSQARNQIVQDAQSYVNYIATAADESHRLPAAVKFIQRLEQSRNNRVIDYLPQYEQLLTSHGY
jgi:hypothetical protein